MPSRAEGPRPAHHREEHPVTTQTKARTVAATDLTPGDIVDFDPNAPYIPETARASAEYDYATIEATKGYLDAAAGPGETILYIANYGSNILLPANTPLTVTGHDTDYDTPEESAA